MGCCNTRDVSYTQREKLVGGDLERFMLEYEKQQRSSASETSESWDGLLDPSHNLASEISRYAGELRRKAPWVAEFEGKEVELKSLPQSKFSTDVSVAYMKVVFSPRTTPDSISRVLETPQIRMKWDTSLLEMKESPPVSRDTRLVYYAVNHPVFGRPKDFVEKKVVKKTDSKVKVVFHSTESLVRGM